MLTPMHFNFPFSSSHAAFSFYYYCPNVCCWKVSNYSALNCNNVECARRASRIRSKSVVDGIEQ